MSRAAVALTVMLGVGLALSGCSSAQLLPDEASAAAAPASAIGTAWGDDAFLEFNADGTFLGNAGCNAISGDWREADGEIRFDVVGMTQMRCADSNDWSSTPATAEVTPTTLTLLDHDDAVIAVLPLRS